MQAKLLGLDDVLAPGHEAPELRPYQEECKEALISYARDGGKRALVAMATGTGKTVVFAQLPVLAKKKTLVLCHRQELLDQAKEKIEWANPYLSVEIEQAERKASADASVVVASIQTLSSRRRLEKLDPQDFSLVIHDESHHVLARTHLEVLSHFGLVPSVRDLRNSDLEKREVNAEVKARFESFRPGPDAPFLCGFTATPYRTDKRGLEWVFDKQVFSMDIRAGMEQGWLCPIRGLQVQTATDIRGVKHRGGDFAEGELSDAVNTSERNSLIVQAYRDYAAPGRRKTLIFCVDVQHAVDVAAMFELEGVATGCLLGSTPKQERREVVEGFKAAHDAPGGLDVLVNVEVATEGFDAPLTACLIMARPTESPLLYCLDAATEVLTPDGWRQGTSLVVGDRVAAFDPVNDVVRWESVRAHVLRPLAANEYMMELRSDCVDMRMTSTHRMVWSPRKGRSHKWQPWQINTAEEVGAWRDSWRLPVGGSEAAFGIPLTDDELRFVAWVQTDGTVNRITRAIGISQSLRYPEHLEKIESVLAGIGVKHRYSEVTTATNYGERRFPSRVYRISYGKPRGEDKHLRGWGYLESWIPKYDFDAWQRLSEMDARQWEIFLGTWHDGDGSKMNGQSWVRRSYHLAIADKYVADWVQGMCVRRGWRANISRNGAVWIVHCKKGSVRYVGGLNARDRSSFQKSAVIPGEQVWCISVPSGAFITRRNGKAAVVGNCQMLGRGTRLAESKPDLLVLDMVDMAKHTLVNTNTMFGLPPKISWGDKNALEMGAWYAEQDGKIPQAELDGLTSIEAVEAAARGFDPLRAAQIEDWLSTGLAWTKTGSGYALSLLNGESLGVVVDLLGGAELRHRGDWRLGAAQSLGVYHTAQEAIREADLWVAGKKPESYRVMSRDAGWRAYGPSEKQLALARKLKIVVPPGATRGDVSALLNGRLARGKGVA